MKRIIGKLWPPTRELLCIIVLLLAAWRAGEARLKDWGGPAGSLTNDLFVPAILLNAGHGFTNIDPSDIPEMRAFLDFKEQHFDLALVTDDIETIPLHPFQEFHRYLIYTVALTWRIFDVSWDAMKILILFYLFVSAVCVYGIARLCMNFFFSALVGVAFVYAQPVLWTLPTLRDFVKAPFILAVLFVLGIMMCRTLNKRNFLMAALALGMLLGVGMGFRRDMMVFLPVCVFFLFAGSLSLPRYGLSLRLVGTLLFLAVFLVSGLPIHRALRAHGYVAAHDTIMGFATFSDHELGVVAPASYEKHYLLNDLFCTLRAHDAAKRGVTFPAEVYQERSNMPEFDLEMKQAYVFEMATTFPADMLTRAYAAVLRIATGVLNAQVPPARFIETHGLWFMAVALLLVAGAHPFKAWLMVLLLCFFCGITSLQFAIRHMFHMSFVPYFFAGLAIHRVVALCVEIVRGCIQKNKSAHNTRTRSSFIRVVGVAAIWAFITAVLFLAPLHAARAWQRHTVTSLKTAYAHAERSPISHETLQWDGRTLFVPAPGRACRVCQNIGLIYDIQTRVLSAHFAGITEPVDIRVIYEWENISLDFSAPFLFALHDMDSPVEADYFFPIHKTSTCTQWNHFVGISVPDAQAHLFAGFSQVHEIEELGLLVNMVVPEQEELFIDAQTVALPWFGADWTSYTIYDGFNPFLREMDIRGLMASGAHDAAVLLAEDTLLVRPDSIQFTFLLAEALKMTGRQEDAYKRCVSLLERFPDNFVLFARLDRYFDARGGAQRRAHEWQRLVDRHPELQCAALYLEKALADLNKSTAGIEP